MLTRQQVFLFLLDIKVIVDFETSNLYGHAVFSVCWLLCVALTVACVADSPHRLLYLYTSGLDDAWTSCNEC